MGPTYSHVEIAISDNRGNRIILPHATWNASIERRADIERLMQSTVPSPLSSIQDLNVVLVKVYDTKNIKLLLHDTCFYMKLTTVFFLFELEQCVEQQICVLQTKSMYSVNEKFKYFVSFLRQNCITNKRDAANTLHKIYDKNSIMECELVVYRSLNYIVHAVLKIR